jgi:hypothetical protein
VLTHFTAIEIADSHELETPFVSLINKFLIRSKETFDNGVLQSLVTWVMEEKRGCRDMTSFDNHSTDRCIINIGSKSKEIGISNPSTLVNKVGEKPFVDDGRHLEQSKCEIDVKDGKIFGEHGSAPSAICAHVTWNSVNCLKCEFGG